MLSDRLVRRVNSIRWLFLIALLAIAFSAQAALAATKVIKDADKDGVVHMKLVDRLELRLKSNPSTGYMWYVEKESTPLLKMVHQPQTDVTERGEGRTVFQVFRLEP